MARTNSKHSTSSSKNSKSNAALESNGAFLKKHQAFLPLLALTFIVWVIYRALFKFPVIFDETIGKAIFFGLPVWLYIMMTGSRSIIDTLSVMKFKRGLLLGIAIGGIYGFVAVIFRALMAGGQVQQLAYFTSSDFWWQFLLSLLTGFWETLIFYSWIMIVVQEKFAKWTLFKQIMLVSLIFTVFHIPNAILRFSGSAIFAYVALMFVFAIGQALLFTYRRNAYALIISQALWGMILLIHY